MNPARHLPLLLLLLAPAPARAVSPAEEARVLETIRKRTRGFMRDHRGIAERRRTVVKEYDPDDRRLLETKATVQDFVHYFYERPDLSILRCTVNGTRQPPGDCATRWQRMKPHIPVFDPLGPRNYLVRVAGIVKRRGQRCYRINVHPRIETARHFRGTMYFRTSDLQLLEMEGTVAKLPFPVKHLFLKLFFTRTDDGVVGVSRGYVDVWVNVPLVFKRRIVTRFSSTGHRAVPRPPGPAARR